MSDPDDVLLPAEVVREIDAAHGAWVAARALLDDDREPSDDRHRHRLCGELALNRLRFVSAMALLPRLRKA